MLTNLHTAGTSIDDEREQEALGTAWELMLQGCSGTMLRRRYVFFSLVGLLCWGCAPLMGEQQTSQPRIAAGLGKHAAWTQKMYSKLWAGIQTSAQRFLHVRGKVRDLMVEGESVQSCLLFVGLQTRRVDCWPSGTLHVVHPHEIRYTCCLLGNLCRILTGAKCQERPCCP